MTLCMCKPRTSPARRSGDRTRWACDAGLSWCPPEAPWHVVSSFGNHSTSHFFFLIPSCNSLKGASYQRAAFSSTAAAYSYNHACHKRAGAHWRSGNGGRVCAGGTVSPWSKPAACTADLRCSCHSLPVCDAVPAFALFSTAHGDLPHARGRLKPFPLLCLAGSCGW